MVEITKQHGAQTEAGKDLHHVARWHDKRPGPSPDRHVIDIVTDDGKIYRFSRFGDDEPWTFEPGTGRGNRVQRTGRLPATVEAIIEAEAEDVAGEIGNGVDY